MFIDSPIAKITRKAPSAVRERRCVGFNGAEVAAKGAQVLGVAFTNAAVNEDYSVQIGGIAEGLSGAAVAVGQQLISDVQGRLIPTDAAGQWLVGESLTAATAANQVIEYLPCRGKSA